MKTVTGDDAFEYLDPFNVSRNKVPSDPLAHLLSLLIMNTPSAFENNHKSDGIPVHYIHSSLILEINHLVFCILNGMKVLWILGVLLFISILDVESRRISNKKKLVTTDNTKSVKSSDSSEKNELSEDKNLTTENSNNTVAIAVSDVLASKNATKGNSEKDSKKTGVTKPKTGIKLFAHLQTLLEQMLSFLGLSGSGTPGQRRQKDVDISESNFINSESIAKYRDEIQTTVGAALGKAECLQKATCRAGKYLKGFRGKEILLVVLEKFSPEKWVETVELLKDSSIHNDDCHYKCFEQ